MSKRIDTELATVREKLLEVIKEHRYTVRSLEREMGVPLGTRRKIVNGEVTLFFRHVLEILEALDIPTHEFFAAAFPLPVVQEPASRQGASAPPADIPSELADWIDRRIKETVEQEKSALAARLQHLEEELAKERRPRAQDGGES